MNTEARGLGGIIARGLWGIVVSLCWLATADAGYLAGTASRIITPKEPQWLSGYAGRNKPAEGKQHDLFIKALALQDDAGSKFVLVTSDLISMPRSLTEPVAQAIGQKFGIPRENLCFSASHTHCGPVIQDGLINMYDMPDAMRAKVAPYTDFLKRELLDLIADALKDLKPAQLSHGKGIARFAINRRELAKNKSIILGRNPLGPVNHDVPVLKVESEGQLRAIVFGYACHNTTLSFYEWCGDYAGFAQAEIEKKHPKALAMFWTGCGGDANPNPRGTVELAKQHGQELAEAVLAVLQQKMQPIEGKLRATYTTIALPLAPLPTVEQWRADTLSKTYAARKRAERYLAMIEKNEPLPKDYPHYPVQVWKLGDSVTWLMLGGEVVIDYDIRLRKSLPEIKHLWIMAYANDCPAYIPSVRVLQEGGYEANFSMIYYGMPSTWAPAIEDLIVNKLVQLTGALK